MGDGDGVTIVERDKAARLLPLAGREGGLGDLAHHRHQEKEGAAFPTIGKSGDEGFDATTWFGMLAQGSGVTVDRARLTREAIERLIARI